MASPALGGRRHGGGHRALVSRGATRWRLAVVGLLAVLHGGGCEPYGEAIRTGPGIAQGTPWTASCAFNARDLDTIRAGLALWPEGTVGSELSCTEPGKAVPEGVVLIDRALRQDPGTYGAASGFRMDLYTGWQAERDERRRRATVGHELGHLLGLGHVADTACLMSSPAYAPGPCPAELEAVATR